MRKETLSSQDDSRMELEQEIHVLIKVFVEIIISLISSNDGEIF